MVYTLTTTNSGAGDGTYSLTDELTFGAGITIDSVALVNTAPGTIVPNAAWDGLGDHRSGHRSADRRRDPPAGRPTHSYTVTVVFAAPATVPPADADCVIEPGESGSGLRNESTLTGESGEQTDEACAELPTTEFDKNLDVVVANGDGTYTLTYLLTVERTGNGPNYDLTDTLLYGDAVTVESIEVTSAPAGVADQPGLRRRHRHAGGRRHFHPRRRDAHLHRHGGRLDRGVRDHVRELRLHADDGRDRHRVHEHGVDDRQRRRRDRRRCEPPPAEPDVDKGVTSGPTPLGDGQYQITYDITVTNPGAGIGEYDITDVLSYGDGITVVSAAVANTTPGTITVNAGWNGGTDTVVVDDEPIEAATVAGPAIHVYTATVVVEAESSLAPAAADCDAGDGEPEHRLGQQRHDHHQRRRPRGRGLLGDADHRVRQGTRLQRPERRRHVHADLRADGDPQRLTTTRTCSPTRCNTAMRSPSTP